MSSKFTGNINAEGYICDWKNKRENPLIGILGDDGLTQNKLNYSLKYILSKLPLHIVYFTLFTHKMRP
jgi:hypothetical protein